MKHTSLELNLDEWINASLDGKLNEAEQREFDHYLAAHPGARETYEETQAMNRLLEKTLKKEQPDPGFEDRMVSRFRRGKNSRDLGFWKNWASLWQGQKTVYAGALAALVISFYIGGMDQPHSNSSDLDTETKDALKKHWEGVKPDAAAQKVVDEYFNSPDPIHYVPPEFPLTDYAGIPEKGIVLSGDLNGNAYSGLGTEVTNRPSNLNITYGNIFNNMAPLWHTGVLSSYKTNDWTDQKFSVTKGNTVDNKSSLEGVRTGADDTGRGDYNLNGLKIALEKPLSDEAKLQNGFNADIMLGEDRQIITRGAPVELKVPALGDIPVMGRAFGNVLAEDKKTWQENEKRVETKKEEEAAGKKAPPPKTQASTLGLPPESKAAQQNARELFTGTKELGLVKNGEGTLTLPNQSQAQDPVGANEIQRKLIRNANIGMEVKSYASAIRDLTRLAADERGFVATQNDRTQSNGHTAGQVVIKLPPDRLDEFVLRLREVGTIQRQVLKMDDVTKAYFDTEARLRNARKTEERLLELMAKKTDKVADLLQVEKEIGRVRESIEQMQGELKLWDSLASLATVTIDLVEQDMDQAAAYLLKETANLSLYSADVEKSYADARALSEKSEAQIVTAQISRSSDGGMNATLSLLAAPDKAFLLIEQLKGLGRVQSFDQDTQRVAQDGRSGIAGTTRKDKVEIQVSIVHDDASRKTVSIQVITPEVEKALDQCKKAALAGSGEVMASNLQRDTSGHSRALLTVRLPAKNLEATKAVFASQGRVAKLSVARNDETGANLENEDTSPVILALTLSDEEPPVQVTRLDIEGEKVAAKVEELKNRARSLGIEIRASSFVRNPNGIEQANLVFRMTQKEYAGMLESLLATGKTLNMALERSDRIDSEKTDEANEPVEVLFRIKSPAPLVDNENGFVGAVKHTLVKSFNVLGGSLQRIVTGFAYLLPWLLVGGAGWYIWKRVKRKK